MLQYYTRLSVNNDFSAFSPSPTVIVVARGVFLFLLFLFSFRIIYCYDDVYDEIVLYNDSSDTMRRSYRTREICIRRVALLIIVGFDGNEMTRARTLYFRANKKTSENRFKTIRHCI